MKYEKKIKSNGVCPDIFSYFEYLTYLNDWLAYAKAGQSGLTIQELSKMSGLSVSYLSMIFSGSRKLTYKSMLSLAQVIKLSKNEIKYFEALLDINDGKSQEEKADAYDLIQSLRPYRKMYQEESVAYEYLTNWFYVAIREMAALSDFKIDPEWIQKRLIFPVSVREIKEALDFLIDKKLIVVDQNKKSANPGSTVGYHGGIHRLALARFHQEMFNLAVKSIESVQTDDRNILGFTLAVGDDGFDRIKKIIDEAYQKIEKIANEQAEGKKVVHVEFALFPLSKEEEINNEVKV